MPADSPRDIAPCPVYGGKGLCHRRECIVRCQAGRQRPVNRDDMRRAMQRLHRRGRRVRITEGQAKAILRRWELYRCWAGVSSTMVPQPTGRRFWTRRGAEYAARYMTSRMSDGRWFEARRG